MPERVPVPVVPVPERALMRPTCAASGAGGGKPRPYRSVLRVAWRGPFEAPV
ncbi:MAG: hypothetical protein JKY65_22010 [Planctomycetes bacterium]|nr:hypothetical protein [Planctomycetota bacterium]